MKEIKPDFTLENYSYDEMYQIFESMYNKYPVQMGRYDAFGHALADGFITEEMYKSAADYYGNLWHYVGD